MRGRVRLERSQDLLALGGPVVIGVLDLDAGTRLALEIVEAFLSTPFGGGRHAARVAKIDALLT